MMPSSSPLTGEPVVDTQSQAKLPFGESGAAIHGPGELERPHETRRNSEKYLSLPHRFAHQCDVAMLQIPDSSMNQPR